MKLSRKRTETRPTGRQRAASDRQKTQAYSYLANRAERTKEPDRRKTGQAADRSRLLTYRFWARRSGLIIALIAAVICLISIISVSSQPRIVVVDTSTRYTLQSEAIYQRAAAEQLSSSIFNRTKPTFDTTGAARDLQQRFPELTFVSVTLPLVGHRPIYHIEAGEPAFVLRAVNGSYVVDQRGHALLSLTNAPQTANDLPVVTDQSGRRVIVGKQMVSAGDTAFIKTVVKTLAVKQVTVASMMLPGQNAQELDVRVAGQPYLIKFDMHQEGGAVRQQVGSYLAMIDTLRKQGTTPAEYVDVRVLGRAYYK